MKTPVKITHQIFLPPNIVTNPTQLQHILTEQKNPINLRFGGRDNTQLQKRAFLSDTSEPSVGERVSPWR